MQALTACEKQCCVCGIISDYTKKGHFDFGEVKSIYSVGYKDICGDCGKLANGFVNYYGEKNPADLSELHRFLTSGALPMRDFNSMMNAGYF